MIRAAVLVSGGGTNLQALLDAQADGRIHSGRIVLVVSNKPEAYGLTRAQSAGVETAVLECPSPMPREEYTRRLVELLREHSIDMVVLAGFLLILSPAMIAAFPDRILNVHPSLIPSFCGEGYYGLRVHQAALDYGVKVTGATVHLVSAVCDGGRIIRQKAVDVLPDDTPATLQRRVMEQAEWVILPEATEWLMATLDKGENK